MNYKQISDLVKKPGTWFEVFEDYVYDTEFETQTILKGTKMQFIHPSIASWHFRFDKVLPGFLGIQIGFWRSRLLKPKIKEFCGSVTR